MPRVQNVYEIAVVLHHLKDVDPWRLLVSKGRWFWVSFRTIEVNVYQQIEVDT